MRPGSPTAVRLALHVSYRRALKTDWRPMVDNHELHGLRLSGQLPPTAFLDIAESAVKWEIKNWAGRELTQELCRHSRIIREGVVHNGTG